MTHLLDRWPYANLGRGVESRDLNEAPAQAVRVVDCKYQYILSIPTLQGSGTYEVQIWINSARVPTPGSPGGQVKFDIK